MSHVTIDIHNYEGQYRDAEQAVAKASISDRNKQLIFGFRDACFLHQACGKVRLIRIFGVLITIARMIDKDFDQTTRADIESIISQLVRREPPYSPATLSTYRAILKRFMSWVLVPGEFPRVKHMPESIAWITIHIRARDKHKLQRNELLTADEVEHVLATVRNVRDRALISILCETGGHISEIGNLQIKHVIRNEYGYNLELSGKTGQRSPLVVSSAPYLTTWLNQHPCRDDPDSALWVTQFYKQAPRPMRYEAIREILAMHFKRAGITKRIHPHIFRHSRATYVLATGVMNEAQAKAYFGWTPSSDMLATYSHLVDADANNAILRENNLTPTKQQREELRPRSCPRCKELNPSNAENCTRCHAILNLSRAYQEQEVHDAKEQLFASMFKLLVEKGLVDEAARAVHEAGLGSTLKRLASHPNQEQSTVVNQDQTDVKQDNRREG